MRRFRRFSVVLAGLLLLQVMLTGVAAACAMPDMDFVVGGGERAAHAHANPGDRVAVHHGHAAGGEQAPSTSDSQSHHSGQVAHCPAAMACAQGVAAVVAFAESPAMHPALLVVAVQNTLMPASIAGAPETPPPRG